MPPTSSSAVPRTSHSGREQAINDLADRLFSDLAAGNSDDLVLKAVVHTARSFDLDPDCFRRFLRAMTNSLTVTSYDTFDDLLDYMDGSAAVIGEMLLPILEPSTDAALPHARDFAVACRLTECWCDVARDLERGRVYIPQGDLLRFGADPWMRRVTPEWRALMAFEIRRTHEYFAASDRIATELPPSSARCVRTVRDLHVQMLDRIDRVGADVFTRAADGSQVADGRDRGAPLAAENRRDPAVGSAAVDSATHAIEIAELEKRYGDTRAVDGVTLSVPAGEVFGLLGPNGAGKTTTVEILEGYRRADAGEVRVLGLDPWTEGARLRPKIGVMLQSGGLYPGLKPLEALRLFASYYDDPDDPERLLHLVGLEDSQGTMVRRMSGGQQQRLSLALSLVGRPTLVFLDEPTAGMDPHAARDDVGDDPRAARRRRHGRAHHARDGRSRAPL